MRLAASLLASSLLLTSAPAFASNLIVNGGFEDTDFTGWTTNLTYSFVLPSTAFGYDSHSGGYYAALGDSGTPGTLSQTFTDTPGTQYQLTYYLASDGETPNFFSAAIDSTVLSSLTNIAPTGTSPYPYVPYSFTFTGTGSDTLTLSAQDNNSFLALDDVGVAPAGAVTPEPSSALLIGTGLAGLLGLARRRRLRV